MQDSWVPEIRSDVTCLRQKTGKGLRSMYQGKQILVSSAGALQANCVWKGSVMRLVLWQSRHLYNVHHAG